MVFGKKINGAALAADAIMLERLGIVASRGRLETDRYPMIEPAAPLILRRARHAPAWPRRAPKGPHCCGKESAGARRPLCCAGNRNGNEFE
jgi:hypothetical protein